MRPKPNSTLQRLNLAAEIIRHEGKISHARLAVRMNVGLAALEKYRPALLDLFDDLRFENYNYSSIASKEDMAEAEALKVLMAEPEPAGQSTAKERRKR